MFSGRIYSSFNHFRGDAKGKLTIGRIVRRNNRKRRALRRGTFHRPVTQASFSFFRNICHLDNSLIFGGFGGYQRVTVEKFGFSAPPAPNLPPSPSHATDPPSP